MKVIFLDIDGVLCTMRSHFAYAEGKGGLMHDWDVISCLLLRRLCEKHNLKLIISSSWRQKKFDNKYPTIISYLTHYVFLIEFLHGAKETFGYDDNEW